MIFHVPFSKYFWPKLYTAGNPINFGNSVKYFGINLNQSLADDNDIMWQVKFLYTAGNKLQSDFLKLLFRTHCSCFYAFQLWCNFKSKSFRRLRVAYNDCYCMLHEISRFCSAGPFQIRLLLKYLML